MRDMHQIEVKLTNTMLTTTLPHTKGAETIIAQCRQTITQKMQTTTGNHSLIKKNNKKQCETNIISVIFISDLGFKCRSSGYEANKR